MDTNVEPNHEVPKWSETRWTGCWNPDQGVGLYLHMGRFRKELDIWWAQTVAYLPDGKLVVDRSWGRQPDDAAIRTGNYELAQLDDAWSSSFDGVGELTTTEALAAGARGAGSWSVPMRWEASAEAAAPAWDLYGGGDELRGQAGDSHVQQSFRTSGELVVDGETYSLEGVGYKDHSSGVRGWDGYGDHCFVVAHMPDWTAHGIVMRGPTGEGRSMGALFQDGEERRIRGFEMPAVGDALGGPNEHEVTIEAEGEEPVTLAVEVLHQCPITITDAGDNVNGLDWEAGPEPVIALMEGAARFTGPGGEVGYGYHERGIPLQRLERPGAAERRAVAQSA